MRCQKRLLNGLVESTNISIINECDVVDCNEWMAAWLNNE
jgi:hypothetical protein